MRTIFASFVVIAILSLGGAGACQAQVGRGVPIATGTVVDVQHGQVQREGATYGTGAAIGAAVGSAVGFAAARNARGGVQASAGVVGGLIGGAIGKSIASRPRERTIVIVQMDNGGLVALPAPRITLYRGMRVGIGQAGFGHQAQAVIVPLGREVVDR